MKPLIGITCSYDQKEGRFFLPEAYIEAVVGAGGVPVLLPGSGSIDGVLPYSKVISGLLLSGGGDIDPLHFNEEPHPALGEITPDRDRYELMLLKSALKRNIPVLGICRGIQVINVACGGDLVQHIPSEIKRPLKHSQQAPRWYPSHNIFVHKNTRLNIILNCSEARVNSFHHQSVKNTAPDFIVSAISSDGVIEAIEHSKHQFVIGVQWHPECMVTKESYSRTLFSAFIEAAQQKSVNKRKK